MPENDAKALIDAQVAVFVALGGTMGTRALLHASTLLADLCQDGSLNSGAREILKRIVAAADANVVAELEVLEPAE